MKHQTLKLQCNKILYFSGHCMMEEDKLCSPKTFSAATSPIKDTLQLRYDSRELGKKLVSRDVQTDKYSAGGIFHSSSSSEKVQQAFFVEDAKLLIHQFVLSKRDRSNNRKRLNVLFRCSVANLDPGSPTRPRARGDRSRKLSRRSWRLWAGGAGGTARSRGRGGDRVTV